MSLHAQHSISSAFCMYGSELLGGLQPPEPPPPPPPPPRSATEQVLQTLGCMYTQGQCSSVYRGKF